MLYNLGIYFLGFVLKILSVFDSKVKKGNKGRSASLQILESQVEKNSPVIWFHCASLGEYEQGLPVFKIVRHRYPNHLIILTFFSPSGYENRKNTDIADVVLYLPLDTLQNAKRFIGHLKPQLAIFVKYEIWANYLDELEKANCKTYLISALFRKEQLYFKWYGGKLKRALKSFERIFVQDENSKELLQKIGYENSEVWGDTRLDRVFQQLEHDNELSWLRDFKGSDTLIVFGSTWPEDEKYIIKYINENSHRNIKYLIVPHEISARHISSLKRSLLEITLRFTDNQSNVTKAQTMILDAIGYLSRTYSYADIAFVGGAVGKSGLHNILEPAVFGIPIIIGNHYSQFPEAKKLIDLGGVFPIKSYREFSSKLNQLIENTGLQKQIGEINYNYIKNSKGSVIQITDNIRI